MQRYCEDCGHKAKPGDVLCNECGGTLVEHELDVPEVPAFAGSGGDAAFDLDSLLQEVKPADEGDSQPAHVPPPAVFDEAAPEPGPVAGTGSEGSSAAAAPAFDLDDLLKDASPAPPAAPERPAEMLELDEVMGPARRSSARPAPAEEPLDLDALLGAPVAPQASPPTGEETLDLDALLAEPLPSPTGEAAAQDAPAEILGDLDELLGVTAASPAASGAPIGHLEADIAGAVTRYALEGPVLVIGRIDPGRHKPDIDLSRDDAVSRRHAEIRIRESQVYLVDTGSTNGTRLNGTPCEAQREYLLSDGDKITVGEKCVLTVHL